MGSRVDTTKSAQGECPMKLVGKLKEKVSKAETKEQAKEMIEWYDKKVREQMQK